MMTSSNGNIFRATGPLCGEFTGPGEFSAQRPVTRSFDIFFDLRLNKRLSKQSWGWWFETLSGPLWRHGNVVYFTDTTESWGKFVHCSYRHISTRLNMTPVAMKWSFLTWTMAEISKDLLRTFVNILRPSCRWHVAMRSKPPDRGFYFSNRSEIWQASQQHYHMLNDMRLLACYLAASRHQTFDNTTYYFLVKRSHVYVFGTKPSPIWPN